MTNRRSFLLGIGAALAAPAIVRAESIMKIASLRRPSSGMLLRWNAALQHTEWGAPSTAAASVPVNEKTVTELFMRLEGLAVNPQRFIIPAWQRMLVEMEKSVEEVHA